MRTALMIGCLAVGLLAGCGTSPTSVPPAASVSSEPSTAAVPESPAPASSPVATASSASSPGGSFTVCPTPVDGPVCPLPPGDYVAAVHDQFGFSISESGWQEERQQSAEFATLIVLSRVDDPDLRLTFLSGPTGPTSPVDLGATTIAPPGFTAGQPVDLTISGTEAQYLDLVSAGAQAPAPLNIGDVSLSVEPDRSYRLTLAKIPMEQESATVVMVTEAPADNFATFVTMADAVVRSVKF
jgi:hypothetical protein